MKMIGCKTVPIVQCPSHIKFLMQIADKICMVDAYLETFIFTFYGQKTLIFIGAVPQKSCSVKATGISLIPLAKKSYLFSKILYRLFHSL
jgi:hypothetical protein